MRGRVGLALCLLLELDLSVEPRGGDLFVVERMYRDLGCHR